MRRAAGPSPRSPPLTPPAPCPDEDELLAYVSGMLPPEGAAAMEAHLTDCAACASVLAEAGRALVSAMGSLPPSQEPSLGPPPRAPAPSPAARLPEVGDTVGRYRLLAEVGRGAMGVVYAAEDPDLGRRVAVKLVRTARAMGAIGAELEARLGLEAKAMARLTHNNVVAVYDIGSLDAGVWLAMELVEGQTLRDWLRAEPRPWRQVLQTFLAAGDGLAAAHAVDVIHRDFKPENVLVDRQGRARVTDFGLARVSLDEATRRHGPASTDDPGRTQVGTVLGTPAYMAPEQLRGEKVDARADQFAFGASLYEALYGARPYTGKSLAELRAAHDRGQPAPPPASPVPAWVRKAVLRAVATAPEARFPSMDALLQALRDDPLRRVQRVALPLAGVAVVVALAFIARHASTAEARACEAGVLRAEALWPPGRAQAVQAAFHGTGKAFAADTFAVVSQRMQETAGAWSAARLDACRDTWSSGEQSQELLDLRLQCLAERADEAEALVDQWTRADEAVVKKAPAALAGLPSPAICEELDRLRSRAPMPVDPAAVEAVRQAQALRAEADAAGLSGRIDEGIEKARQAQDLAAQSAWLPVQAEVAWTLYKLHGLQLEAPDDFLRTGEQALTLGVRAGDDRLAASAALGLANQLAMLERDEGEPRRLLDLAEALVHRGGQGEDLSRQLAVARATLANAAMQPKDQLPLLEAVVQADREAERQDAIAIDAVGQLGWMKQQLEDYEGAVAAYTTGLAMIERMYGRSHPRVATFRMDYGAALGAAGRPGPAIQAIEAGLAVLQAEGGEGDPNVLIGLITRGSSLSIAGRHDDAIASLQDVIVRSRAPGMPPMLEPFAWQSLSSPQLASGRPADALASAERSWAGFEAIGFTAEALRLEFVLTSARALEGMGRVDEAVAMAGEIEAAARQESGEGTFLAEIMDLRGRAERRAGRADQAVNLHREALRIREVNQPDDSLHLVSSLLDLGEAHLAGGDMTAARDAFERARGLLEAQPSDPQQLARARFGLARALAGQDPARSTTLAQQALDHARSSPYPSGAALLAELRAWQARP